MKTTTPRPDTHPDYDNPTPATAAVTASFTPATRVHVVLARVRRHVSAVVTWGTARRRTAFSLILRGVCTGIGTGAIGLLVFWSEHHL